MSRKRRLTVEAAEQRAQVKRAMLVERERIELDLINERLEATRQTCGSSVRDSTSSLYNSWGGISNTSIRRWERDVWNAETIARLYEALNWEAKESVDSLMVTACSAKTIMKTLELRFGNADKITDRIVTEIKALPRMYTAKTDIVSFATKVRNSVSAIQCLDQTGHLHNPNLLKEIISKIPPALIYEYNRFVNINPNNEPRLVKLSEFLYREAEIACVAGTSGSAGKTIKNVLTTVKISDSRPTHTKSNTTGRDSSGCKPKLLGSHEITDCNLDIHCSVGGCKKGHPL